MMMQREYPNASEVLEQISIEEKVDILKEGLMNSENGELIKNFNLYKSDCFFDAEYSEEAINSMSKEFADQLAINWIVDGGIIDELIKNIPEMEAYIESNYEFQWIADPDAERDAMIDDELMGY